MSGRDKVIRERLDAVDENITLALREGSRGLGNLSVLTNLNYNTCRQRLNKLLRYHFIAKPGYGEYALTERGRRFIEELTLPLAPDLKDPKLKKLIDMLPTELHQAFFRLSLSGIISKHLLADIYDDGYPAFILGGETKSFKTALAKVICRLLGLRLEECIYPLFSAVAGEFGIRRFRAKGNTFHIAASPFFKQPFVCLDEFDKVTDRDTKRNVLFFLDGRGKFLAEGELVESRVCAMVTLNTKIGKDGIAGFGIPEPYIRRSVVADTEHVRIELKDVDLVAKNIFEMRDFPQINLYKLHLGCTKVPDDVFNGLRNLLLDCTAESFQILVDMRPIEFLTLGRSVLLGDDVREAAYQTMWDRLVCLESLGGTVSGWREVIAKEWARYKREEQLQIEKQLREAEEKEKQRVQTLARRSAIIEENKVAQIENQAAFILHRAELASQIQELISSLGRGEPLAETLRWLLKNIRTSVTPEQLSKYEESFKTTWLSQTLLRLEEKKAAEDLAGREREFIKAQAAAERRSKQSAARLQREKELELKRQRKVKISELRAVLKQVNYYLRRKDLREGEDPVLTLQQLRIIQPIEGSIFPRVSDKIIKGYWLRERWTGRPYYSPPTNSFIDYDAKIDCYSSQGGCGRIYKWFEDVRYWTSWVNVWPLLQEKKTKILDEMVVINGNN